MLTKTTQTVFKRNAIIATITMTLLAVAIIGCHMISETTTARRQLGATTTLLSTQSPTPFQGNGIRYVFRSRPAYGAKSAAKHVLAGLFTGVVHSLALWTIKNSWTSARPRNFWIHYNEAKNRIEVAVSSYGYDGGFAYGQLVEIRTPDLKNGPGPQFNKVQLRFKPLEVTGRSISDFNIYYNRDDNIFVNGESIKNGKENGFQHFLNKVIKAQAKDLIIATEDTNRYNFAKTETFEETETPKKYPDFGLCKDAAIFTKKSWWSKLM